MPADEQPMYLSKCVSRARIKLLLTLRNGVRVRFETPWGDAFSAGVSMFTPAHACTLMLQQGTELVNRLHYDFNGGMYAINGHVTDISNEIRRFHIFCQCDTIDRRRCTAYRGMRIVGPEYSLVFVKNTMLKALREITDSFGGGQYLDETPAAPPAADPDQGMENPGDDVA